MKRLLLGIFLFIAFLVEGTFTSVPLIIDILLLYYILYSEESTVFIASFIIGIFLDSISVRAIGESSLFLITFLFVVMLYQRKFEITTWPFVVSSSFLGAFAYLSIFGYQNVIASSFINSLLATGVFLGVKFFIKSSHTSPEHLGT